MFPFDSVFYHLVLFAFNCLIFKELCRWFLTGSVSRQLLYITTSAILCQHFFSNYFQFCFSVVTVSLTTLLSYHLLTLFVNIFFHLPSTFFLSVLLFILFLLYFILFILYILYILVCGWRLFLIWLLSGWQLALIWLWPGSLLVLFWFVISLSHPPECFASAFYFGSGYFGTYCLHKKIPPFYKQNLFIAVIYFLEP